METRPLIKVGEICVGLWLVNFVALVVAIPVVVAFGLADRWLHGVPVANAWQALYFFLAYAVGLVVHEFLHGVGYTVFGRLRWNQLKFGINWKGCAFYCNCTSPISLPPFRLAGLLPTLVLFPLTLGLWLAARQWWMAYLAAVTLLSAIGDFFIWVKTLRYPPQLFIVEHPSGIGGDLFAAQNSV